VPYRILFIEGLVSSIQQIDLRVVELWKIHSILLAICLTHEPTPEGKKVQVIVQFYKQTLIIKLEEELVLCEQS